MPATKRVCPRESLRETERGVALLLAIVALTIMSILVSAGFYAVRQESRMGAASGRVTEASYLAEDAVTGVLANWRGDVFGVLPVGGTATVTDSTRVGTTVVEVGRKGAGLYFLASEARVGLDGNGGAASTRRMGMMARLHQTQFYYSSALTTAGNVAVSGTARVDGTDHTPTGWGSVCSAPTPTRSGIAHLSSASLSITDAAVVNGSPALDINDPIASAATTVFSELTWAQLVALADKTIPGGNVNAIAPVSASGICDTAAPFNWGNPSSPSAACGAYFPIIHVAGDARLTGGGMGQGILLIDGDLDVILPFGFFGVVVVRGAIDTESNVAQLYGHVRAQDVTLTSVSPTNPSLIALSTCAIERAVINHPMLTRAVPIGKRSWVDLTALEG